MLSLLVLTPWLSLASMNGCNKEKATEPPPPEIVEEPEEEAQPFVSKAPSVSADPNRTGDYAELAGSFPKSIDIIVSSYGVDLLVRSLQRAWQMTDRANAFKAFAEPVTQLASKDPADSGLNLSHPMMIGVDVDSEQALVRIPVSNETNAKKTLDATLKEMKAALKIRSNYYAMQSDGSAMWVLFGKRVSAYDLREILNGARLSSEDRFSKLAAKTPKGVDFSVQMTKGVVEKAITNEFRLDRELQQILSLNVIPDSLAYSYRAEGKSVIKSHHSFAADSFIGDLKVSNSSSDLLSLLPHQSGVALSSHLDIKSVLNILKDGKLGEEAQAMATDFENNPQLKDTKDTLLKGLQGPVVATIAPGKNRRLPLVPIVGVKIKDSKGYKKVLNDLCGNLRGSFANYDGSSFCVTSDYAVGVWKSHLLFTDKSYLSQLGQSKGAQSAELKKAMSETGLLTAAVDFDAVIDFIPENPEFTREVKGLPGALGFAAVVEMMRDYIPKMALQSVQLNGNVIETETVLETDIVSLSSLIPILGTTGMFYFFDTDEVHYESAKAVPNYKDYKSDFATKEPYRKDSKAFDSKTDYKSYRYEKKGDYKSKGAYPKYDYKKRGGDKAKRWK